MESRRSELRSPNSRPPPLLLQARLRRELRHLCLTRWRRLEGLAVLPCDGSLQGIEPLKALQLRIDVQVMRGSCYALTHPAQGAQAWIRLSQDLHSASIAGVAGVEAVAAGAGGAAAGSGPAGTSGMASSIRAFGACPGDKLGSVRVGVATRASWSSSSSSTISAQLMEFNRKRCPGRAGWTGWRSARCGPALAWHRLEDLPCFKKESTGGGSRSSWQLRRQLSKIVIFFTHFSRCRLARHLRSISFSP